MTTATKEPTNGHLTPAEPVLSTVEGARAILEQAAQAEAVETQERLKRYTEVANKASEDYKAGILQTVTLPGGETVSLASWLKSINANVVPGMQVVSR